MRKEQLLEGVIEAARLVSSSSLANPPIDVVIASIDVVIASIDVDLFPEDYRETMFVPMHAELRYDSNTSRKPAFTSRSVLQRRRRAGIETCARAANGR